MNFSDNIMFPINNKLLLTKYIYIYVKFISFIKVRKNDIINLATQEPP